MVSGYCCFIEFSDSVSESRFLKWVVRGNDRCKSMGYSSLNLNARVLRIKDHKYLFLWSHSWLFNFAWFLRFMFWMQLRKVRKQTLISRLNKLELVDLVLERGLKE